MPQKPLNRAQQANRGGQIEENHRIARTQSNIHRPAVIPVDDPGLLIA